MSVNRESGEVEVEDKPNALYRMIDLFIDRHRVEGCGALPDNGRPLSWPCNLHLAALQDPPTNTHTLLPLPPYTHKPEPPPPPYAHSVSALCA